MILEVPPSSACPVSETRIFELELEEKYQKLRVRFEKIKKNQKRMKRWRHYLEVQDGLVFHVYKNEEGEVMKLDSELMERMATDMPEDLEKIDEMTDEEVKKWRKERMERVRKEEEFWQKFREFGFDDDGQVTRSRVIEYFPDLKIEDLEKLKTKSLKIEEKQNKSVVKPVEKPKPEVKKGEKSKNEKPKKVEVEKSITEKAPPTKPIPIPPPIKSAPPSKPEIPVKIETKKTVVKPQKRKKKNPCCEIM